MASRRQRREWRSEFKGLGTRQVTERERRSIWHNEREGSGGAPLAPHAGAAPTLWEQRSARLPR
jgi:hypothetical protein